MTQLEQIVGSENVSTRLIDRLAYSHDASLYRLVPSVVIRPKTSDNVRDIMVWCSENGKHLTFRTAGTSLSGQAVSDDVLVDLARYWKSYKVLDEGARVAVQPGVTGGRANAVLRPYGRKLGPDPASMTACMIGGIVANNASGMCCGTALNSYHTIDSMVLMLVDGTRIDTATDTCDSDLATCNPRVYAEIAAIRDAIRGDSQLCERIRFKYRIKNTIGYSLNAFLDEYQPARILARLMVGSEGTLGFIEEVTFRTVPDAPHKLTALLLFGSIEEACSHIEELRNAGAAAVELMDDASLASFAMLKTTPDAYRMNERGVAALLVEFQANSIEESITQRTWATAWSGSVQTLRPVVWAQDATEQAALWRLRKGLMPTLGAMRPSGTTMINEDVAVPIHRLPQLVLDVRQSCIRHGYHDAIIFGHAKDGNIHFVVNQAFHSQADIERYHTFMNDIASIVVTKHDGSLKAEHGTGRNMAPYLELEWGSTAVQLMRRLKQVLDPNGVLNPDVILSDNPHIHTENIKAVPDVNAIVDKCIECGFCEHVCPSRNVTLTPRQRIVVLRELEGNTSSSWRDGGSNNTKRSAGLTASERSQVRRDYQYESIDTCAADGMCELVCPVSINTGSFVKQVRSEQSSAATRLIAKVAASNYRLTNAFMRLAAPLLTRLKVSGKGQHSGRTQRPPHPDDSTSVPSAARNSLSTPTRSVPVVQSQQSFVLLSGCGTRWLDGDKGQLYELAKRAGLDVHVADHEAAMCCGQIFESRGLTEASQIIAQSSQIIAQSSQRVVQSSQRVVQSSQRVSQFSQASVDNQHTTVVVDSTTCAHAFASHASNNLKIIDTISFLEHHVVPRLQITNRYKHVVLHPGCGAHHLGVVDAMRRVAEIFSTRVTIPLSAGCCGMAGDRGLRYPELLESALRDEANEIATLHDVDGWFGANTTCEIGLSEQTGKTWRSLTALVADATR